MCMHNIIVCARQVQASLRQKIHLIFRGTLCLMKKGSNDQYNFTEIKYVYKFLMTFWIFLVCNQSLGMWWTMSATHAGWIRQWN